MAGSQGLTLGRSVVGVDPAVVHVQDVDAVVSEEILLVAVALVSIKVHYHHLANPVQVCEHELCEGVTV